MSPENTQETGKNFSSIRVPENFKPDRMSVFRERIDNESRIRDAYNAGVEFFRIVGEDRGEDGEGVNSITHMIGNESYSARLDEEGRITDIYYLEVTRKNGKQDIFRCILLNDKRAIYVGANSEADLLVELDKVSVIAEGKESGIFSNGKMMPNNDVALPSEIDTLAKRFKDRGEEIVLERKKRRVLREEGLS
jgi:hypothetical protein